MRPVTCSLPISRRPSWKPCSTSPPGRFAPFRPTGGSHTEVKLTPDGPRVIEVNGRLGGGIPEMLFQASGESIMRLSMRIALGERIVLGDPVPCSRIGWRFSTNRRCPPVRWRASQASTS